MASVSVLIETRKFIRKSVTEHFNKREEFISKSSNERYSIKSKLLSHQFKLNQLDEKIIELQYSSEIDGAKLSTDLELNEQYQAKIISCLINLEDPVSTPTPSVTPRVSTVSERPHSLLRSIEAPLPVFSACADGEDLACFLRQFEDTLSKYNTPDYDKLVLLKRQLSGRALILINSLEADRQGYEHAKDLLQQALASPRVVIFNIIEKLTKLKMTPNSEPFNYISQMRLLRESVGKNEITIEDFLNYFFWVGLEPDFQSIIVQMTNKPKPSMDDIFNSFFSAAERYSSVKIQSKAKKAVVADDTGMAASVKFSSKPKTNFKPCNLCAGLGGQVDHPIFKCTKFPSPQTKLDRLRELGACFKCGNTSHKSPDCKYSFKSNCRHCDAKHFTFLCVKSESPKNESLPSKPKPNEVSTSSNCVIVTDALTGLSSANVILPTFTCKTGDSTLRCLKDGGSQSNFIRESLANKLGCRLVRDDIHLKLNGINGPQNYFTKLIECSIDFGDVTHQVQAICLPEILLSLNLPESNTSPAVPSVPGTATLAIPETN